MTQEPGRLVGTFEHRLWAGVGCDVPRAKSARQWYAIILGTGCVAALASSHYEILGDADQSLHLEHGRAEDNRSRRARQRDGGLPLLRQRRISLTPC
jgi:hypothetical protein